MTIITRTALAFGLTLALASSAQAAGCGRFADGAMMCERSDGLYYREAGSDSFERVDRETLALLLAMGDAHRDSQGSAGAVSGPKGSVVWGTDGLVASSRGGCAVYSGRDYDGSSFSVSSGC
ncbi:MAG: hypothetical protein K2Q10_10390 [Rhodospirillales bacterium]|nr:hypothetical protein [Rhodospirillales bacterium]